MKLKGKLIVSFTAVSLLTLMTFGIITYYTFSNAICKSAGNIIRLQAERTILTLHSKLHHKLIGLFHILTPEIGKITHNQMPVNEADRLLRRMIAGEPLINSIYLYRSQTKDLFPISSTEAHQRLLKKLSATPPTEKQQDGIWFKVGNRLYLLFLMDGPEMEFSFVAEINQEAFRRLVEQLFTIDNSVIYLSRDHKLFMPPIIAADRQEPAPSLEIVNKIRDNSKNDHELGRAYRPDKMLFGTNLTFLIPNEYFNTNLISLKNRLITAMIIIGWCAIWVILILANSIAKPVRNLTKLTKDIIAFNYSSELEVSPRKDEIGELAINFETMRLKIKDLVTKDQLTHVYNRRFLMHVFELAVLRAIRLNEKMSCIMIDIDYFKKVNDTYGHQAGDAVLVEIGKLLLDHTRDYDTPARYGGEEFILVLPNTDLETAREIAERIRQAAQKMMVYFDGKQINCTLSLGISQLDKYTANTTEKIISLADSALYTAKENGRNQTVIYGG